MALTSNDVARLAAMARIELTAAELDQLVPQIDVIVESVASVAGVADQDIPPTSPPIGLINVSRPDVMEPIDWPTWRPQVESQAPAWQDDRFRVPRILEENA